jgi:hypothetical protein
MRLTDGKGGIQASWWAGGATVSASEASGPTQLESTQSRELAGMLLDRRGIKRFISLA